MDYQSPYIHMSNDAMTSALGTLSVFNMLPCNSFLPKYCRFFGQSKNVGSHNIIWCSLDQGSYHKKYKKKKCTKRQNIYLFFYFLLHHSFCSAQNAMLFSVTFKSFETYPCLFAFVLCQASSFQILNILANHLKAFFCALTSMIFFILLLKNQGFLMNRTLSRC